MSTFPLHFSLLDSLSQRRQWAAWIQPDRLAFICVHNCPVSFCKGKIPESRVSGQLSTELDFIFSSATQQFGRYWAIYYSSLDQFLKCQPYENRPISKPKSILTEFSALLLWNGASAQTAPGALSFNFVDIFDIYIFFISHFYFS